MPNSLRYLYPQINNYMTKKDIERFIEKLHQEYHDLPTTAEDFEDPTDLRDIRTLKELEKVEDFWRQILLDIERSENKKGFQGWHFYKNPLLTLELTPISYPISDEELDESHSLITRGHDWFQIGKWIYAEDRLYRALQIGISTNNLIFVFSCLVWLCINYFAASEFIEPLKIIYALSEIGSLEKIGDFDRKFNTIHLMTLAHLDKWDEVWSLKKNNKIISLHPMINEKLIDVWEFLDPYEETKGKVAYWNLLWRKVNR